ncbi:hypothetical protein HWV23_14055 [Natronomonas halophila]|uniref:hypothetical protein n=1 Tax=Natronomonas halophila TaxID=2747817 RepID=UPI0015B76368|nr:hypothetical protein [Natronomonas halophila]QLD86801.1 hypothetical protein HWV23_14055 [Natronomonas halophila]
MFELPLQLIDDFLMNYHVGHALLLAFIGAVGAGFAVNRSVKVLGIQFALFGLLFIVTPSTMMPTTFLYLGIGLAVIGPVIAISAKE